MVPEIGAVPVFVAVKAAMPVAPLAPAPRPMAVLVFAHT